VNRCKHSLKRCLSRGRRSASFLTRGVEREIPGRAVSPTTPPGGILPEGIAMSQRVKSALHFSLSFSSRKATLYAGLSTLEVLIAGPTG